MHIAFNPIALQSAGPTTDTTDVGQLHVNSYWVWVFREREFKRFNFFAANINYQQSFTGSLNGL
jgi:hypothetical protein